MIAITKEEAMNLREKFGDSVGIAITNRHKKGGRKRYYAEESKKVLVFLGRWEEKPHRRPTTKRGKGV